MGPRTQTCRNDSPPRNPISKFQRAVNVRFVYIRCPQILPSFISCFNHFNYKPSCASSILSSTTIMLGINFREHKWAVFYCGVSTLGALCYGYDRTYLGRNHLLFQIILWFSPNIVSILRKTILTSFCSLSVAQKSTTLAFKE
jgi:hypothetical protein